MWAACCRFLQNVHQLPEFRGALVFRSRGERGLAHLAEPRRILRELTNELREAGGIVGIGGNREALCLAQGGDIAFARGHGNDGLSGGEDTVHFAGDYDSLQSAFDGDDVGVRGGENRGDFVARKEGKEADVGNLRGGGFEAKALRAVAHEDEADAIVRERGGA